MRLDKAELNVSGLYLICTFPPKNSRVQEQVFGRTARNGQPGCGAMILLLDDVKRLLRSRLPNHQQISSFEQLFSELVDGSKSTSEFDEPMPFKKIAMLRNAIVEEHLEEFRRNQLELSMLRGRLFTRMCETMKTIRQKVDDKEKAEYELSDSSDEPSKKKKKVEKIKFREEYADDAKRQCEQLWAFWLENEMDQIKKTIAGTKNESPRSVLLINLLFIRLLAEYFFSNYYLTIIKNRRFSICFYVTFIENSQQRVGLNFVGLNYNRLKLRIYSLHGLTMTNTSTAERGWVRRCERYLIASGVPLVC